MKNSLPWLGCAMLSICGIAFVVMAIGLASEGDQAVGCGFAICAGVCSLIGGLICGLRAAFWPECTAADAMW